MSMSRPKRATRSNQTAKEGEFNFLTKPEPISWEKSVDGKDDADFRPYSVHETYVVGDLIMHPRFGKGVVRFVEGKKIEVLFEKTNRKFGHAL